jgi:hypothetical protein
MIQRRLCLNTGQMTEAACLKFLYKAIESLSKSIQYWISRGKKITTRPMRSTIRSNMSSIRKNNFIKQVGHGRLSLLGSGRSPLPPFCRQAKLLHGANMKPTQSLLSIACSLLPVLLAAITYWLWWTPKRFIDIEPYPLTFATIAFWVTVVAILACLVAFRRSIRVVAAPLLIAALIITIPARTALVITSWWLKGIPQAEIRVSGKQTN